MQTLQIAKLTTFLKAYKNKLDKTIFFWREEQASAIKSLSLENDLYMEM